MNRLLSIVFLLIVFSFPCWAGGNKDKQPKPQSQQEQITPQQSQSQQQEVVSQQLQQQPSEPVSPTSPFYSGDGGKGMSLAILAPSATGLENNQSYIPALVQGEFVSNFSAYSAISIMDRENLDNVYAELLSGYYDDNAEAGLDLGHLTPTDYLLNGSITKTATGYSLQIRITTTSDKSIKASYSGSCTFAELDNLTGIRRASLDLLGKLNIMPTERTRMELTAEAATNHVNAQTALARGVTAQITGSTVAALTFYNETTRFASDIPEANRRLASLTQNIKSGNIAENIRNDFQRREAWRVLLSEAVDFYSKNPIFNVVIDPQPSQGKTDYAKGTVDLEYRMSLESNAGFRSLFTILVAYWDTGKADEWNLDDLIGQLVPVDKNNDVPICIEVHAELTNGNGVRIATGRTDRSFSARDSYNGQYPSFVLRCYPSAGENSYNEWAELTRKTPNWPRPWNGFNSFTMRNRKLIFSVDANAIDENMSVRLVGIQYSSNSYGRYGPIVSTECISSILSGNSTVFPFR